MESPGCLSPSVVNNTGKGNLLVHQPSKKFIHQPPLGDCLKEPCRGTIRQRREFEVRR